jgi:hypothetical protein
MRYLLTALICIIVFAMFSTSANASCPVRADNLQDFARCMVPLKGTIGTASVYSSGKYDHDHQELMAAMASQNTMPPQVMPADLGMGYPYAGLFSPYGYMYLNYAYHSSYRYRWYNYASLYYPIFGRPNIGVSAYYRLY